MWVDEKSGTGRLEVETEMTRSPFLRYQVSELCERTPIGLYATGVNALVAVAVLWPVVDHRRLGIWLFCQWGWALARYVSCRRFRACQADLSGAAQWRNRFIAGATVSGVLWGATALYLFPVHSAVHQVFLMFVLGGMVAGATGSYAIVLPMFFGFTVPALVPLAVRLLGSGGAAGVPAGVMVVLFGMLMSWTALQNHRVIMTSFRRQFENEDLIASLMEEKQRSENLNGELALEVEERECAERELVEHRNHLEELVSERSRELTLVNQQLQEEIAERSRAEKRIARVAREWTETFDTMSDCISITGTQFEFLRVNRALAKLLGLEPNELIGKKCYELMHGLSEPWPDCPHLKAMKEKRTATAEVDDPYLGVPLLVTCSPFHDGDGNVVGTVHTARDISAQKRAERTREELIAELQEAMANVKTLTGLLPICASCKKIRDDQGYWKQIESYIRDHSEAEFSHGICPDCVKELYPEFADEVDEKK